METVEVKLKIKLTQQDIDDIMSAALDGGICYWCKRAEVIRDYLGEYASEQISRGGMLRLHTFEDGPYILTKEAVLFGFKRYVEESGGNAIVFIGPEGNIDASYFDADAADCIVQYAVFHELVYG